MFYVLLYEDILLIIFGDTQLLSCRITAWSRSLSRLLLTVSDSVQNCSLLGHSGLFCLSLFCWVFPHNVLVLFYFFPVSSLCSLIVG